MTEGVGGVDRSTEVGAARDVGEPDDLDAGDRTEITAAADAVDAGAVVAEATDLDLTAPGDTFEPPPDSVPDVTRVEGALPPNQPFDPRTLADPNVTGAELAESLRGLSTPQLTETVGALDTSVLGFGADVTPQGNEALRSEVDRRFLEAMDRRDYTNPEMVDLAAATIRQDDFGEADGSVWARSWQDVATTDLSIARRSDPSLQPAYETAMRTNELMQHRTAGRVPAELMTNRELLGSVDGIPGMRLGAEFIGLTGIGFMAPGLAEQRSDELLGELDQRMARGEVPLFDPATGESTADGLATAATVVGLASLLTPQGALRRGFRELVEGGADTAVTAARIVRREGDNIVDRAIMRNVGEALAGDDVARAAYAQLQRRGTEVVLDFGPPPSRSLMGTADHNRNLVTIYMQNNRTADDVLSTLVHESSHINRFARGQMPSQLDEFYAFRREFLQANGRRPTSAERAGIWERILRDYPELPPN